MSTQELLAAALAIQAAGLTPLPIRPDGSKRPMLSTWTEWQTAAPPDAAAVVAWFDPKSTAEGLGIVTGAAHAGNREVMEFEGRALAEGLHLRFEQLVADAGLTDVWQRVRSGFVAQSPSGGRHFHLVVDGGPCLGNTKLARRPSTPAELEQNPGQRVQVLIETRGAGGFIVMPPSNGRTHATGRAWSTVVGSPATAAVVTPLERDALYELARQLDAMPEPEPIAPAAPRAALPGDGARPGDDFNARATWEDILLPHGWQVAQRLGRTTMWTRPGKNPRQGISATSGRNDGDNLYVFSTSTELPTEQPLSKFHAVTLLEHNGDWSAAARALRAQGYGAPVDAPPTRQTPQDAPQHDDEPPANVDPATGEVLDEEPLNAPTIAERVFGATPVLATIRQAAHARLVTPWAVLGSVLARVVAEVPPHVVLPPLVGSDASINLAVALVAESGGGKSGALGCAADAVHIPLRLAQDIGPGSGEGIAMAFLERDAETKENVLKAHPLALLTADEVAQVDAVTNRASQATFGPIVRSMLTGGHVATTAVDRERRRRLPANSYRLCIVSGVQPKLSDVLLSDTDAGTPQRWLWMPADDPSWDVEPTDWPTPVTWDLPRLPHHDLDGRIRINVPDDVRHAVHDARIRRLRREGDPLDGHRLLTREKVAAALAILHGSVDITTQWWELAGLIMHVSDITRAHCQQALNDKATNDSRARGRLDAVREAGARDYRTQEATKHARALWRAVAAEPVHSNAKHEPGDGCTGRCLSFALRSYGGAAARPAALETALDLGWLEERDGRYHPGPSRPNEEG